MPEKDNLMTKEILIFLLISPIFCFAQVKNIGTPNILNYSKSVYNGGTQNWDISQDKSGFMYFANNDGVLMFDGFHWELLDADIPLPVRSVFVDSNNQIFVGLIDNFGVMELNNSGRYEFHSLRHLINESHNFSDVWRIHEVDEGIVFQAFEKLFIYKDNNIKVYSPKEKYRFSFNVKGKFFIQEHEFGLYSYLNGVFEKVTWANPLKNDEILSILEFGENNLLLGTVSGFFKYENGRLEKWECSVNDFIKTNKLFCAASILENHLAFGTILNGVVISDEKGNIIQHLNRDRGLQNNTILSLYPDNDKNLWLGLDNGIDYVEINSPISYISEGGDIGTGYCSIMYNDKLYFGTNQGLFVKPFGTFSQNNESFGLIENTEGQVWSLTVHENQLICGHNFGTFIINNKKATKISDEPGGWKYVRSKNDPNTLIGGFYSGLATFKNTQNGWRFHEKLKGFGESCRFIVEDENGFFWISHGAKGIFRISLNEKLDSIIGHKLYNQNSGLPSNEQNILFLYKEKGFVSTIDGIYEYDFSNDRFKKSDNINRIIGNIGRLKTLKTDNEGNLWFIGEIESGVLRVNEDLTYTKISAPFKSLSGKFVNEFEFVYPINNDHAFFAIDKGFAHYSSKFSKSYTQNFQSFITRVELNNLDSVLNLQNINSNQLYKFSFKRNSFRFHYTSPFFENLSELRFSYMLENYSDEWSDWNTDSYKDFTNLWEGNYNFKVKAKNIYGAESEVSEFRFTITPPWHRSKIAYYTYFFLIIVLVFLLVRFILYRINLAKKREKLKHENKLRKREEEFQHQSVIAEKEIIRLRNDKLRAEKAHRDKELANQTLSVIQKNRFLSKLFEELQRIENLTTDATIVTKMVLIRKRIKKELDDKDQNILFETYFDEVHETFFKRLKEKYPQLSANDLRLCAYIKMNISTKEISTLLNISYRGVEISRYRLRKKLDLPRDVNLSTFLLNI